MMPQTIQQILVPLDYCDASLRALDIALSLSKKYRAQVHLLHVAEGVDVPDTCGPTNCSSIKPTLVSWLADAITHRYELQPTWTELAGNAPTQIIRWLRHHPCDLVVMGRAKQRSPHTTSLGSTTYKLVKHAACPVLVVPEHCCQTSFSNALFPFRPVSGAMHLLHICQIFMAGGAVINLQPFADNHEERNINLCRLLVEEAMEVLDKIQIDWPAPWCGKPLHLADCIADVYKQCNADLLVLPPSLADKNSVGYMDPQIRHLIASLAVPFLYLCNVSWLRTTNKSLALFTEN